MLSFKGAIREIFLPLIKARLAVFSLAKVKLIGIQIRHVVSFLT